MTSEHILPDPATAFGEAVRRRLREEEIIWLTTVGPSGMPQPNPVWFLWQEDEGDAWGDGSFLIYHLNKAARLANLTERPKVSLNFDGGAGENEVMVFTGLVEILAEGPQLDAVPAYAEKYAAAVEGLTGGEKSVAEFMAEYSVVSRVRPTRVRGF